MEMDAKSLQPGAETTIIIRAEMAFTEEAQGQQTGQGPGGLLWPSWALKPAVPLKHSAVKSHPQTQPFSGRPGLCLDERVTE